MTKNAIYRRIVGDTGFRTVDAGDFKESDHPRDEGGKFTSGGGGGGAAKGGASAKPKTKPKAAAANGKEAENPAKTLGGLSAPKLKAAINSAVEKFGIDGSWSAPKTNGKEELIEHINDLCNEHNLRVTENGSLEKPKAAASTVKTANEGYGFHGSAGNRVGSEKADAEYAKMAGEIQKMTGASETSIRDYLDSRHGRHLGDVVEDNPSKAELKAFIEKDFKRFIKEYDPADFGGEPAKKDETVKALKKSTLAKKHSSLVEASKAKRAGNQAASDNYTESARAFGRAEYWLNEAEHEEKVGNTERAERYRKDAENQAKDGQRLFAVAQELVRLNTGNGAGATINLGTEKYPMMVKRSDNGGVPGFVPPGEAGGDYDVYHAGHHYSTTGKTGTNRTTGEKAWEYSSESNGQERRLWMTASGKLIED